MSELQSAEEFFEDLPYYNEEASLALIRARDKAVAEKCSEIFWDNQYSDEALDIRLEIDAYAERLGKGEA